MRKGSPRFEWQIAESEAEWEQLRVPPLSDGKPGANHSWRPHRYRCGVAGLLLLLAVIGDRWWRTTEAGVHQAGADTRVALQPALGAADQGDEPAAPSFTIHAIATDWPHHFAQEDSELRAAIQTNIPTTHLAVTVHSIALLGEQAVANLVTADQHGTPTHRQTRFYRRTLEGWQQTAPHAALWGPERSLVTPSFVLRFRQNDAQAVMAVKPQLEALETTLRHNFGLPLTSRAVKLVIDVRVTHPPGNARFEPHDYESFVWEDRLVVASPARYWAPVELTDSELLAQSLALPLVQIELAQASERHTIGQSWQPLLNGLYWWQLWDLDLPLATWRAEVVKWVFVDVPATKPGTPLPLPAHYTALCAAHQLWTSSPAQLNIPLLCARPEWEEQFLWRLRRPLLRLSQSSPPLLSAVDNNASTNHAGEVIALATIVEYIVATYGRERLPMLLKGLGQHDTWETLLPAVFGVSPTDFEAGWQAYLKEHYGVSSSEA